MTIIVFVVVTAITFSICDARLYNKPLPKLLIISYDAFRYDYFDKTPFLRHLKYEGTHTDYMTNVFTTKTFPNHHTIATGLYVENHGVVDSKYYDRESEKNITYSHELYHYNNDILPIWTLNEKAGHGRHSGDMMWPGSEFEYGGIKPTFIVKYKRSMPFEDRVDKLISWFNHPETPVNFAVMYVEEPDRHGHNIGINNPRFDRVLEKVDNLTRYLHEKIRENELFDLNVIHLSDHGMSAVTQDRIINLTKYIEKDDYFTVGLSPVMSIFPRRGKAHEIFRKLERASKETRAFNIYTKKNIPERYHYSNNPRIGPILVVAKSGYSFETLYDDFSKIEREYNVTIDEKSEFGLHGYDNNLAEMHPFFFGVGPAFIPRCKVPPFNNVDLFPLFCDILDISCPSGNGTLSALKRCLTKYH